MKKRLMIPGRGGACSALENGATNEGRTKVRPYKRNRS